MKSFARLFFIIATIVLTLGIFTSPQAASSYVYRQRANWVKFTKLNTKQLAGETLLHPAESLSSDTMANILQSVHIGKGSMFKNELKTATVFSREEATRFAPYIVDALKQAGANQVINFNIVHKRPQFILRNDYLSNLNIYITADGIHLFFNKIFARLDGDYAQMSGMDEAFKRAKTVRVVLEAQPGQKLSFNNPMHLIIDQNAFAGANWQAAPSVEDDRSEFEETPAKTTNKKSRAAKPQPTYTPSTGSDTASRLQQLEQLKKSGLITDREYQTKRAEILKDL